MDEYVIYYDHVQFCAFRARVCYFLRKNPAFRRRKGLSHLTVSEMMRITLMVFRHNLKQKFVAGLYRIHQSTVSRILSWMRRVFLHVLSDYIPSPEDIISVVCDLLVKTTRPVILLVDGTLIPISQRKHNREDYSGKHRKTGKNLQVVSDVKGQILHLGPILPGRRHDRRALTESGIEAVLANNPRLLVHADKGYTGTDFIVPAKASKLHPLTIAQRVENKEINTIRCAVERAIAGLKVLDILRTGIRTHAPNRELAIKEIISVAIGLFFFKQKMSGNVRLHA
jgi:hypothetical protein